MTSTQTKNRGIGKFGTVARIAVGTGFIFVAFAVYGVGWMDVILGLLAYPVALLLWQRARLQFNAEPMRATGVVGFAVNLAIGIILFIIWQSPTLLFFGASMLLAAARGYAGCEILAISNWLLGRDDQVGCVVFSPIDAVEAKVGRAS